MKEIFPIEHTLVENGNMYKKRLEKGDEVKCPFCEWIFPLDTRNTMEAEPGVEIIRCPACRRRAEAYYYFDRVINSQRAKLKKPPKKKEE